MRFLLVKPRPPKESINLQSFMMCEPLELEYCAALLESMGHQADIADLVIDKRLPPALHAARYDAVAFTAYQIHIGVVRQYAAYVKRHFPGMLTMVGGVQAEVVPESFAFPGMDVILTGGLWALREVVRGMERGASVGELRDLGRTPGGGPFDFPPPDRSKTARYRRFYNYIYHDRCATVKTSFGCPYRCDFCFCTQVCGYAQRDIEAAVDEIASIEEDNIFIVDDDFLFDRTRLEQFCTLIEERGIRKTFLAFGRADFIAANPDLIARLASCGFDAFFVGLESFKADELNDYQKQTTVETNRRAVRVLESCGVQCYSGLIVGYDWTKEDFDSLIRYLNEFEHPMVNIQPITPIRGTPYYEKTKHLITEDEERYGRFDMAHAVMKPQHLSKRSFYWQILRAYFKTSASRKGRRYIRARYGKAVYRRVRRGAMHITWQYIRLILHPD